MTITKAPRRIWALDRDESWFEKLRHNRHNPDYMNRWKEEIRMSGRKFEKLFILRLVSLEKQNTHLATSKPLAVGKPTAAEIANKFREVLAALILSKYYSK